MLSSSTTYMVAIIWTDDSTSVSQGAYSKCQSVALVVQIAYKCPQRKGKKKKTHWNISNRNDHLKKIDMILLMICHHKTTRHLPNTCRGHVTIMCWDQAAICGTYLLCKAYFFWLYDRFSFFLSSFLHEIYNIF